MFLIGDAAGTITTFGVSTASVSGVRSFTGSYGIDLNSHGLTATAIDA